MKEVLDSVMPDMGLFDMGAIVSGPKTTWLKGWPIDLAKIFGCIG
jgi:hypothetical protein